MRRRGAVLALAVAGLSGCGAAPSPRPPARALRDRPDDRSRPQIHFVYAVPAGPSELDHRLDTNETLTNAVYLMLLWFHAQRGSPSLRVDTFRGWPDITYVRLPRSDRAYERAGPDAFVRDVHRAGLRARRRARAARSCGRWRTRSSTSSAPSPRARRTRAPATSSTARAT